MQTLRAFLAAPVLFFLLCAAEDARAIEIAASRIELEGAFIPAFDAGFRYSWDAALTGRVELNGYLGFSGGAALGRIHDETEIAAFAAVSYALPFFKLFFPLELKAAYIYNNVFDTTMHVFLPTAGLSWRFFGFAAGPALRYSVFGAGEDPLFEPVLGYSVWANLYNTETARVGLRLSNFNDFAAKNYASYSFYLDNRFRLSKRISLSCELEVAISGNVARLTSVYGMAFKEGVILTW